MAAAGAPWQLECENVEQRCGYLLTSGQWSNCTFVVGSENNQEVVPAHKLVLAMASPVFEAMFYGGLSEYNEPIVPIPDIPPKVFRALLQYIYTGNISIDSFSSACNLWYGAKKYMLPYLVKKCTSYISSILCPGNATKIYEFARLFDEKTLTDKCIKIICTNTKEVLNDSSFEDVDLKTVISVCSLEHLTVDSELDLFHAVARYAEAQQRRQGQISSPADEGAPSEELFDKVLLPSPESSSRTSPAVDLDSKPPTEVVTSEPTADKENLKEEEPSIRAALQKIRFLSLSSAQFAQGPARSDLLTEAEVLSLLMNIASEDSPVPMPTGFSECRERRRPRSDWVNKGPLAKPKASPESRSVAATNLLTPAAIVRGLSSSHAETVEQAARAARRMTCADADGARENLTQLVAAGGIPPLVAALHHPRLGVQYDAAAALNNIACEGKHAMALVNDGAVPVLVSLLEGGGAIAEPAARALGNIATGGNTARDAVVDAGALSKLRDHMRPSTPSAPLGTYLHTYRMICQMYEICEKSRFVQLSPAAWDIVKLLVLADEEVLAEACGVLACLADGAAEFDPKLFTPLVRTIENCCWVQRDSTVCATRLTALLRPAAATRVQTAALAAVGSMLRITVLRDQLVAAGCLEHIIRFLKSGNHSHVKKAAQVSANIMLGKPGNIQLALDKGILDALGPALTEGDDECKLHAVLAIFYICDRGSSVQLRVLAASAALKPYCWLLAAGGSTCGEVLCGLTNLLKKVDHDQNTKVDLIVKLREIGVPQLLINLQQDGDRQIVKLANDLMQTYFNNDQ